MLHMTITPSAAAQGSHRIALHRIAQHSTAQHRTAQHSTAQQHDTQQHDTQQHDTHLCLNLLWIYGRMAVWTV